MSPGVVNVGGVSSMTRTSTVVVELAQPLAEAVIVKVVICKFCGSELSNVPEMMFPVPLEGIPVNIVVLSLVHENVVPVTLFGLVIIISVIVEPGHIVCDAGVAETVAVGFTVMVND